MPKFKKSRKAAQPVQQITPSRQEIDAKHGAALDSRSIISWKSPVRVYKARSRRYFIKILMYALVLILASIAFEWFILVGVILALVFVAFVLALVPPENIEHRITNMGIISGGRAFLWEELDSFWFDKKSDDRLLIVQTRLRFPSRLIILLTDVSEKTLFELLDKHLHFYHGPVHTALDKWAIWLQERINLE